MQPASPGMRSAGCDQSWSTAYHAPNPPPPCDFTPAKSRCSSMCVFQPLCCSPENTVQSQGQIV